MKQGHITNYSKVRCEQDLIKLFEYSLLTYLNVILFLRLSLIG